MNVKRMVCSLLVMSALGGGAVMAAPSSGVMPARDCYNAYRAAKKTLNGQSYADYKATRCQTGQSSRKARSTKPAMANTVTPATTSSGVMSARDCYNAYRAGKKTLNGQSYADYKATRCQVTSASRAAEQSSSATNTSSPAASAGTTAATMTSGNVVFPNRIKPEFASLSPGKARMQTCLEQYRANKATGGNGSLRWVQRGGGYWPQCTAHLKTVLGIK